jgi:hypothetical protein
MNAIAAPKSSAQNRLEGFALTTILQGFPAFAAAALTLSFSEKIEKWRAQSMTSLQLVTNVLILSLLAVGGMGMK